MEDNLNVFHHIYSKEYGNKMKVRKEVQEYPNKPLEEALMGKLCDTSEAIGDLNHLLTRDGFFYWKFILFYYL